MKPSRRHILVLGIYPNARGFAFALFEGSLSPCDWGIFRPHRRKHMNKNCLKRFSALLTRYEPDALVLQDMSAEGTLRARRVRRLNEAMANWAETQGVHVITYSRMQVRACFEAEGLATKQAIAETIARHIPMLERFVPPPRKPWQAEHPRMGIFDAAALVATFYRSNESATRGWDVR